MGILTTTLIGSKFRQYYPGKFSYAQWMKSFKIHSWHLPRSGGHKNLVIFLTQMLDTFVGILAGIFSWGALSVIFPLEESTCSSFRVDQYLNSLSSDLCTLLKGSCAKSLCCFYYTLLVKNCLMSKLCYLTVIFTCTLW